MEFSQDFREFIKLLNSNSVEYLLAGGYAVAVHGYPRFTGDLDVWVKPTPENAEKVLRTLKEFGFGAIELSKEELIKKDMVIQLGYPPYRIDLITGLSGVEFDHCLPNKKVIKDNEGNELPFLGLRDLIANKSATNREQDKIDIKHLRG